MHVGNGLREANIRGRLPAWAASQPAGFDAQVLRSTCL
jgi:hypothetical protein